MDVAVDDLIDGALEGPVFGLSQQEREARLVPVMRALTAHHREACIEYGRIVDAMFPASGPIDDPPQNPFLPVGIFKQRRLRSIPAVEVFKTITSSGTTGQVPSRVDIDRRTANRQTQALTRILRSVLGEGRRPMLIVDTDAIAAGSDSRSARAAGVVGLMPMGRKHTFLLDADMRPVEDRLLRFLAEHEGERLLIFGFTFMVWKYLLEEFRGRGLDLSDATLLHSGGWKHLEHERVDNSQFRSMLGEAFGLRDIVNFYGMAEQVGSVFIEGPDQLLHPSTFAEVIIRDPVTLEVQPDGTPGLVQVLSVVPTSYPGHSILTEDLGVIETVDDAHHGLGGKAFRVLGRIPHSELRGCSDTFAATTRG